MRHFYRRNERIQLSDESAASSEFFHQSATYKLPAVAVGSAVHFRDAEGLAEHVPTQQPLRTTVEMSSATQQRSPGKLQHHQQ